MKIAPNAATPKEPPMERKNVAADVAVPEEAVRDGVLHRHDERPA